MAPPKLYMIDLCPPVRTVLMAEKALGLTLEHKIVNFTKQEQFSQDFLKLSPQQAIPTLVDNGFVIWNSHAIIAYLIGKYANDDSLYPKDHDKRALIDQRLRFDSEVIFFNICNVLKPMIKCGTKSIPKDVVDNLHEAYDLLEHFLIDRHWMAGDEMTIADLSLIPSVTSADILVPIDNIKHPNICAWIKRTQALPYYHEANQVGLDNFKNFIRALQQ